MARMMKRCLLGLGGNIGDVDRAFEECTQQLNDGTTEVTAVSSVHRTEPVGSSAGAQYRNAAVQLETALSPAALHRRLTDIEAGFGRDRTIHWGPRALDLDLLLYGDEIIATPVLTVPHPALWYRRFVLDPLAEIAADAVHPEKQLTIRDLRERLFERPLTIGLAGGTESQRKTLIDELTERCDLTVRILHWSPDNACVLIPWLGAHGASCVRFEELPKVARLNLAATTDAVESLYWVIQSALG